MAKIKFKGERTASTIKIIIGMLLFLAAIHTNFIIGATAIVAAVAVLAILEFEKALGVEDKGFKAFTATVGAALTCAIGLYTAGDTHYEKLPVIALIGLSFYCIILLSCAVVFHNKLKYKDAMTGFFASVAIPYALSTFLMLNNITFFCPSLTHYEGIYLVWMALGTSWLTDVCAFLVGRKLGKHKMCPNISPKKSWEGAAGGVFITAAVLTAITVGFNYVAPKCGYDNFLYESNIKYLFVALFSMILSVISMFGDLAASILKRNVGIKDFSNILPGHGGIIDRFDSCFFVVPVLFGMLVLVLGA